MFSNSQQTTVNSAQESHSKGLPVVQFQFSQQDAQIKPL